jgi:hypothetical protein
MTAAIYLRIMTFEKMVSIPMFGFGSHFVVDLAVS